MQSPKTLSKRLTANLILGSADRVNLLFKHKFLLRDFNAGDYFPEHFSLQERFRWIVLKKSLKERRSMGDNGLAISNGRIEIFFFVSNQK